MAGVGSDSGGRHRAPIDTGQMEMTFKDAFNAYIAAKSAAGYTVDHMTMSIAAYKAVMGESTPYNQPWNGATTEVNPAWRGNMITFRMHSSRNPVVVSDSLRG